MSHKQRCIAFCTEYLTSISVVSFSKSEFESYYKKHKGAHANAFKFGLDVADYIIRQESINLKSKNQ